MKLKTKIDLNGSAVTIHDNRPIAHFSFTRHRIMRSWWHHPLCELYILNNKSLITRSVHAEVTFMIIVFSGILV